MSSLDAINFTRSLSDIRRDYERWLLIFERDVARSRGLEEEALVGKGRELALEAHVRAVVIDPMLRALGWQVAATGALAVEDPVEDVADDNARRRFLDYHGRDCESGRSFLVIEAKRPKLQLPDSNNTQGLAALFAAQIAPSESEAASTSPRPKLRGEWATIIDDLRDYVGRVKGQRGYPPLRAAITNGEWLVLFKDVSATLLSAKPDIEQIIVYSCYEEIYVASTEIHQLLEYSVLSLELPPQAPAAIGEFVPAGQAAKCAQALTVHYIQVGDDQPGLAFKVCAWVRTPQNSWVLFTQAYPGDFVQLDHDASPTGPLATLKQRSETLIAALRAHRQIELISASEFESLVGDATLAGMTRNSLGSPLIGKQKGANDRFRLTVGDRSFFIFPNEDFFGCSFHRWDACAREGNAAHSHPIVAAVIHPRSFFANGSTMHCAHSAIHTLRRNKCLLMEFEQFMCCKACSFHARCWPADAVLPCTAGAH